MGILILLLIFSSKALASDAFEIQVYDGEINRTGDYSLETHLNSIIKGHSDPEYPGQVPSNHLTHMTFEFARGMTDYWELGAYLQTASDADGKFHYAGTKLRSKFVRPRTVDNPIHLSVNVEVSSVPKAFEQEQWGAEIRPIIGAEWGNTKILFNPILGFNLNNNKIWKPELAPAAKVQYVLRARHGVGLEYYGSLGNLNYVPRISMQEHALYAAFDLIGSKVEFNFGVGRGLTTPTEDWIVKTIVGFQL
jgi:hypothetical protein